MLLVKPMKKQLLTLLILLVPVGALARTFNVMAPLMIEDFNRFSWELEKVKSLGADAVSTDVWWGLVEKNDNQFDWSYYRKIADIIESKGLHWVPILSFHQCGGNVGDNCDIKIPSWIWQKYGSDIAYKSEQGNYNYESISAWATPLVLNEYRDVMNSFRENFKDKAYLIDEINISMGPAGEMRFPSYNSHDFGAGYPTRGSLQAYSLLAVESFKKAMINKYQNIQNLNHKWGFNLNSFAEVFPPNPFTFFPQNESWSNYGKDFYEWYSNSLREHGKILLSLGVDTFRNFSSNTFIGMKIPGVHWRAATGADRLAELAAGLISTSQDLNSEETAHGYKPIIDLISSVKNEKQFNRINLHFTCLEMDNYEGGESVMSYAKTLVFWVGREAQNQKVSIKGENALAGTLSGKRSWKYARCTRMGRLFWNYYFEIRKHHI
jgi:beta-amylase